MGKGLLTVSHTHHQHTVVPLKLWYVLVSAGHLSAVQRPETAHHLDGALRRRVPHPRRSG